VDLQALTELPLTYSEVGATAGPLPVGYDHLSFASRIGAGRQRFDQAADAVMRWGMQRGAGLRVRASSDVAAVGAVVVVGLGFLRAPCRVVYVVDERSPGIRRGAVRGTPRPGH
jgi:uncharacterized protein (UPF0548 family)